MFWISCAGRGRCWRWRRWRLGWAGDRGQVGACTVWLVHHTNTAHSEQFAGRKYFASLAAMENISPDCLRKYFRLRSVEAKSGDAGTERTGPGHRGFPGLPLAAGRPSWPHPVLSLAETGRYPAKQRRRVERRESWDCRRCCRIFRFRKDFCFWTKNISEHRALPSNPWRQKERDGQQKYLGQD